MGYSVMRQSDKVSLATRDDPFRGIITRRQSLQRNDAFCYFALLDYAKDHYSNVVVNFS